MVKKISVLFLAVSLVFTLFACEKEEKIFGHAELRIGLREDFEKFAAESFDAAYTNGSAIVGIYRVSFDAGIDVGIPDFLTPEQFARLYMQSSEREAEIKLYGFTPYYEYTELQGGVKNSYLASFYRSRFAYFAVIFACPESAYEENLPVFLSYTESVIFVY